MYLKRKIDTFLEAWQSEADKLPLIVRGARQVGKTEAIRHFAAHHYAHVVEVNFVEEPAYRGIVEEGFRTEYMVRLMSRLNPDFRFVPGKTLLFFDEIQAFPEIATALKFFKQDGRFDVICSGSLLGIHQNRIESNSVGYKCDFTMRSFDFEEFLWAAGYPESIASEWLERMRTCTPFPEAELTRYFSLFTDFTLTGGMPAVVRAYVASHSFEQTLRLQRQLVFDYQEDVRKYAAGLDKSKILAVFNHLAPQLAKENKKFQYAKIAKGARSREYFGCVEWLLDAGVASICHCLHYPELPLKGNYDTARFKLYFADTGLLVALLDEEAGEDLRKNRNFGVYKGALYENMVAEALVKAGYELYYYKREDSTLEADFFVRTADRLIPIEVKSQNGASKSLRTLITSARYPAIRDGIKFARSNLGHANAVTTFPYFCAFLLKRYLTEG